MGPGKSSQFIHEYPDTDVSVFSFGGRHVPDGQPEYKMRKMKTNNAVWIVGALAIILASDCPAQLNGRDDFNDNSQDTTRWGIDFTSGVGTLTETNGRLEFTTSGPPSSLDIAARPWILNLGSYTQNWEIHIDANVPELAFWECRFGLLVSPNATDFLGNNFRLDLVQSSDEGRHFAANLAVNGDKIGVSDRITTSTFAGLRITFDASAKLLSAFYDEDGPNCGYSWTLLGSTVVPAAWNMSATNVLGVWIFGDVQSGSLASTSNVFGDDFYASSGLTPNLGIALVGGKVVLAWSTNAPSCWLEFASTLTPPICWQSVTSTPGVVFTSFTVSNAVSGDRGFYRLGR